MTSARELPKIMLTVVKDFKRKLRHAPRRPYVLQNYCSTKETEIREGFLQYSRMLWAGMVQCEQLGAMRMYLCMY